MSFLKRLWQRYGINPLDQRIRKAAAANKKRFLICWNRGLGDIPLGLYALVFRIRKWIPDAEITFLTRPNLAEGFALLEGVRVKVDPTWVRGQPYSTKSVTLSDFDEVILHPDPTGWLQWQLGQLTPKLLWKKEWESHSLDPEKIYIGVHVETETQYAYEKNWPTASWRTLFAALPQEWGILLFGSAAKTPFEGDHIVDLRGKTSLIEMLSLIKNHCRHLIVPDSGVLSLIYYIDASFPLHVISLWADPEQGVLRQGVSSPNPQLLHTPLIAPAGDLSQLRVEEVLHALSTPLKTFAHQIGQSHLLKGLNIAQQETFFQELCTYAPCLEEQSKRPPSLPSIQPYSAPASAGDPENKRIGEELLRAGKVGCLILAGGQGTRLGRLSPKGMAPVTAVQQKSLFQLLCERAKAAAKRSGAPLPLCIMTSDKNHQETLAFFEENHNFGLSDLSFFKQEERPLVDEEGRWLLQEPGRLALGPDGNGHALHQFVAQGIADKWQKQGVEYVNLIFVDNALADPFDCEIVGFTHQHKLDAALKAVERLSAQEAMGVVVFAEEKMRVIEYSELPLNLEGFSLSSTGMFCLHLPFIQALNTPFPLHLAWKMADVWQEDPPCRVKKKTGKYERFIFDLLSYTSKSGALLYPREQIYAPLKNAAGEKSFETVRQALLRHDLALYRAQTGMEPLSSELELDPAFHYFPEALQPPPDSRAYLEFSSQK